MTSTPTFSFPKNIDEAADWLQLQAAQVRQLAPALAAAIDKQVFAGKPPAVVTYVAIEEAIGAAIGKRDEGLSKTIQACDDIVVPEGVETLTTLELLDETIDTLTFAAAHFHEIDPTDVADAIEATCLEAKLILINVVTAAQYCGLQQLVALMASEVGLNPLPFRTGGPTGLA